MLSEPIDWPMCAHFFGTGEVIEFVVDLEQALTFDFDDGA